MPAFLTCLQWTLMLLIANHAGVARSASLSSPRTGAHYILSLFVAGYPPKELSQAGDAEPWHAALTAQTPGLPSCPGGVATFLLS